MTSFSVRMGLVPEKKPLQIDSMDDELRMGLHNVIRVFENHCDNTKFKITSLRNNYQKIWINFFHRDMDLFDRGGYKSYVKIIKDLYMSLPWHKAYSFIEEYVALAFHFQTSYSRSLPGCINKVLEIHNSAYRMIEGKFIPITSEEELHEVSEAARTPYSSVNQHLSKAIDLFSKRESKDYSAIIHQSINAVEAMSVILNNNNGNTLSDSLKTMKNRQMMHPAMCDAFIKLYAYTSDKETGIRHFLTEDANHPPTYADAKFMLVACSAFINYLIQKQNE